MRLAARLSRARPEHKTNSEFLELMARVSGPCYEFQMEAILEDMNRALDASASYAALITAVTLPEICSRCEMENPHATKGVGESKRQFLRFAEKYLKDWHLGLTGDDLYNLRNGLSHRGQANDQKRPVRYSFTPPTNPSPNLIVVSDNNRTFVSGNLADLNIDLRLFCETLADAARRWMLENKENPIVQKNMHSLLQPREGSNGWINTPGFRMLR